MKALLGRLKDLAERTGSTAVAALLGFLLADGFTWSSLGHWSFWAPILLTTAITLLKGLLAMWARPDTGASLGTSVPTDAVGALKTSVDNPKQDVKAGDMISGPAADAVPTGDKASVTPSPVPAAE